MRISRSLVHFTCLTINIYIYNVYAPLAETFLNIKESGSAVNGEKKTHEVKTFLKNHIFACLLLPCATKAEQLSFIINPIP